MGGFIVIHRKIKEWPLYASMTAAERQVVTEILLLANWKDGEFWYGTHRIVVERGQLAHSLTTIAAEAATSVKVVRITLAKLLADKFVTEKYPLGKGTGPRVLSIPNYDKYQSPEKNEGTDREWERAQGGHAKGHEEGTPKGTDRTIEPLNQKIFTAAAAAGTPPVAKNGKPPRPPKIETDPRFSLLRAAWETEFEEAIGAKYRWQGPADAAGIHRVISVSVEEFRERARRGLRAIGWLRCGTVAKLTSGEVWNQLAGPGPPALRRVIEPAAPHAAFGEKTHEVKL